MGLAGTTLGDFFVFGDVRDAVREGTRLVSGEKPMSWCWVSPPSAWRSLPAPMRASAPERPRSVSALGGQRRAQGGQAECRDGGMDGSLLARSGRWRRAWRAIAGASLTEPALAVHAAREAVKVEKAGGLMQLMRNAGRVQEQGRNPGRARRTEDRGKSARDGAVAHKLAEKQGSKTRATLKAAWAAVLSR